MPHSAGFGQRRDPRTQRPVALGDVVDELLGEDLFRRGMPVATLTKAWPDVVGERLAEATAPVSLEGGCLVVRAADGPWGSQATYLAEERRAEAIVDVGFEGGVAARSDTKPGLGAGLHLELNPIAGLFNANYYADPKTYGVELAVRFR